MKFKKILTSTTASMIAVSMLLLPSIPLYAESITADDVISAFDTPSDERLEFLLNLTDENGVKVSEFSDPELITRVYQIKNEDLTSNLSIFSKYNGDFSAEFDTAVEDWQIPVIKDGEIIKTYIYGYNESNLNMSLKDVDFSEVKNGIGFGMIYPPEKLAQIIDDENIGTPIDIKSSYTVYPLNAIFVYVKTEIDEYIIPCFDVSASLYDEKDEYITQLVFEKFKAHSADKFVEMYKKVSQDKIRRAEENAENRVIPNDTYAVGSDGEVIVVATKTPEKSAEPTSTPTVKPTSAPTPTITPSTTPKPTQSAEPDNTAKPTATATATVLPTAVPQDKITASTDDGIVVKVNDALVIFPDAKPFIDGNDRTQIPIRALAEMLDFAVNWNGDSMTAELIKDNITITIKIGENTISKNDSTIKMDTEAKVVSDRTYIPVRFIGQALGYTVEYK